MKKIVLVSFLILVPFVLSGCIPKIAGGGAPKSEEFAKGKVISGFPASLPLFKGAQVIESWGGASGYGASFIADASLNKVINFYNQSLPQLGWTVTPRQLSDTNFVFEIKNDKNSGKVIVNTAADGKTTVISMSLGER